MSLPSFVPLGEGDQREENMAMVNPSEEEIEWMRSLIIYKVVNSVFFYVSSVFSQCISKIFRTLMS